MHKMVLPLIEHPKFTGSEISINLASYPSVEYNKKPALVQAIFKNLWPSPLRSKFFKLFEQFESLLIAIGNRDHFLHQFHVFLFGLHAISIIEAGVRSEEERKELFGLSHKDEVFWAWLMASSSHDFGRPIADGKKLNEKMSSLFGAFGIKSLSHFYDLGAKDPDLENDATFDKIFIGPCSAESCIKEILDIHALLVEQVSHMLDLTKEQAEALVQNQRNNVSHGYIGAIILGRNVIEHGLSSMDHDWPTFKASDLFKALLPALAAVFIHDMEETDQWNSLRPENNFFAFLLCVADQLQEWDRSVRHDEEWPECHLEDFNRNDAEKHIQLVYHLTHSNWDPDVRAKILEVLEKKESYLNKLMPTSSFLGLKFTIEYTSNCDEVQKIITFTC